MKKTVLFLFLTLFVFSACKKDEDKPTAAPAPGPTAPAVPKIKTTRTQHYIQDSVHSTTSAIYTYNIEGQLLNCISTDSTYTDPGWSVQTYVQAFTYTSFNKISSVSTNGSTIANVTEYIYNSNEKLIAEVENGGSDTLRYTYSGNQIIGERAYNSSNQRYYFSENLDSTLYVDISTFTSIAVVYKHNSKVDVGTSYMNQFYGIVANKHELVEEIYTYISNLGSSTETNKTTRTYYPNGFPKDVTVELDGSFNKTITRYNYY